MELNILKFYFKENIDKHFLCACAIVIFVCIAVLYFVIKLRFLKLVDDVETET